MIIVSRITPKEAEPIIRLPEVFEWVCGEGTDPDTWHAPAEKFFYLGVFNDGRLVGCFAFDSQGPVHVCVHTCMSNECRGKNAIVAGAQAINWIRNNTNIARITTTIAETNPKAKIFAINLGFERFATNPCATVSNGLLCDVGLYGLTLRGE